MRKIFLSSRWDDSFHPTERIYNCLLAAFNGQTQRVFKEVHDPKYGRPIEKKILDALSETEVLLAVVGPTWLAELKKREKDEQHDWVRFEIEAALARNIPVTPVYVDGARMPSAEELPAPLREAFNREGKILPDHENFDVVLNDFVAQLLQLFPALTDDPRPPTGPPKTADPGKTRGRLALALVALVWGMLFWYHELRHPAQADPQELGDLLARTLWVAYDPAEMTVKENQPVYPGLKSIERDLDAIAEAGFTGVVTSGSNGVMAEVPRLAKERGLRVIMGVWDPRNRDELTRAIRRAEFVDAYCVGHDDADPYLLVRVRSAIVHVKRRTCLPATTTEKIIKFNSDLAEMGDWLFPDAHVPIRDNPQSKYYYVDIPRDLTLFRKQAETMADFAQQSRRPLLLKNVAYPHRKIDGASEDAQAEFYRQLMESLRDPVAGLSVSAPIVAQGAFDTPWKTELTDQDFHDWDPYTGLIYFEKTDGNPRARFHPAVYVLRNYPLSTEREGDNN